MTPKVQTKIKNNTSVGKAFRWIKDGLWLDANQATVVPYELTTKVLLEGNINLLYADLAEKNITIEYIIADDINVMKLSEANNVQPAGEAVKTINTPSEINSKLAKDAEPTKPPFLNLMESSNVLRPIVEHKVYNLSEVLVKGDKAEAVIATTKNLTDLTEARNKSNIQ